MSGFERLGRFKRTLGWLCAIIVACGASVAAAQPKYQWAWNPLAADGLHDPSNPGIAELQHPSEVFADFPKDFPGIGNQVDWVRALDMNYINPRTNIFPETNINVLDMDVIMDQTGEMPMVRFPHKAHTQWLDCENCHDSIFKKKADGNPVNMFAILSGEYCGRCHGAVSFPLTECLRCHSVARNLFQGEPGVQPGAGRVYPPLVPSSLVESASGESDEVVIE